MVTDSQMQSRYSNIIIWQSDWIIWIETGLNVID